MLHYKKNETRTTGDWRTCQIVGFALVKRKKDNPWNGAISGQITSTECTKNIFAIIITASTMHMKLV